LTFHFIAPFPRDKPKDARLARGWIEKTGEHFQHGGLAGAVWSEKSDQFAFFDLEGDVIGGAGLLILAPDKSFHGAPEPALLAISAVDLRQAVCFNDRHSGSQWFISGAGGTLWQRPNEFAPGEG